MPEAKPKIFLGGDSWGCGEWGKVDAHYANYAKQQYWENLWNQIKGADYPSCSNLEDFEYLPSMIKSELFSKFGIDGLKTIESCIGNLTYGITHEGLKQYFSYAGFTVFNTSIGASSNKDSVTRLTNTLENQFSTGDVVLFIQTDPLRDLRPYHTLTQEIVNHGGVNSLRISLLCDTYKQLQNTANEVKCEILVIGGIADLYLPGFDDLKNVIPFVDSWVHLLVGHMSAYQHLFPHWITSDYNIHNIDLCMLSNDLRKKVIDEMHHTEECLKMYQEKIFRPDGRHPNRDGHKILFDHIVEKLNITL